MTYEEYKLQIDCLNAEISWHKEQIDKREQSIRYFNDLYGKSIVEKFGLEIGDKIRVTNYGINGYGECVQTETKEGFFGGVKFVFGCYLSVVLLREKKDGTASKLKRSPYEWPFINDKTRIEKL